jgi:glucose uptake protein GlcU
MQLVVPLFDVVSSLGFSLSIVDGASSARGVDQAADLFGTTGVFTTLSNVMLFVVGALSVIMIIIGGFRYVVSGGDSANITTAKNTILYAVIGLVISMLAYAIINFVITSFTVGGINT